MTPALSLVTDAKQGEAEVGDGEEQERKGSPAGDLEVPTSGEARLHVQPASVPEHLENCSDSSYADYEIEPVSTSSSSCSRGSDPAGEWSGSDVLHGRSSKTNKGQQEDGVRGSRMGLGVEDSQLQQPVSISQRPTYPRPTQTLHDDPAMRKRAGSGSSLSHLHNKKKNLNSNVFPAPAGPPAGAVLEGASGRGASKRMTWPAEDAAVRRGGVEGQHPQPQPAEAASNSKTKSLSFSSTSSTALLAGKRCSGTNFVSRSTAASASSLTTSAAEAGASSTRTASGVRSQHLASTSSVVADRHQQSMPRISERHEELLVDVEPEQGLQALARGGEQDEEVEEQENKEAGRAWSTSKSVSSPEVEGELRGRLSHLRQSECSYAADEDQNVVDVPVLIVATRAGRDSSEPVEKAKDSPPSSCASASTPALQGEDRPLSTASSRGGGERERPETKEPPSPCGESARDAPDEATPTLHDVLNRARQSSAVARRERDCFYRATKTLSPGQEYVRLLEQKIALASREPEIPEFDLEGFVSTFQTRQGGEQVDVSLSTAGAATSVLEEPPQESGDRIRALKQTRYFSLSGSLLFEDCSRAEVLASAPAGGGTSSTRGRSARGCGIMGPGGGGSKGKRCRFEDQERRESVAFYNASCLSFEDRGDLPTSAHKADKNPDCGSAPRQMEVECVAQLLDGPDESSKKMIAGSRSSAPRGQTKTFAAPRKTPWPGGLSDESLARLTRHPNIIGDVYGGLPAAHQGGEKYEDERHAPQSNTDHERRSTQLSQRVEAAATIQIKPVRAPANSPATSATMSDRECHVVPSPSSSCTHRAEGPDCSTREAALLRQRSCRISGGATDAKKMIVENLLDLQDYSMSKSSRTSSASEGPGSAAFPPSRSPPGILAQDMELQQRRPTRGVTTRGPPCHPDKPSIWAPDGDGVARLGDVEVDADAGFFTGGGENENQMSSPPSEPGFKRKLSAAKELCGGLPQNERPPVALAAAEGKNSKRHRNRNRIHYHYHHDSTSTVSAKRAVTEDHDDGARVTYHHHIVV
mmetsp:Transcript_14444/g.36146  ORF Transcript_14444/g.36146 Transcript_14444/m.36146 type:complete len:1041 (+) Transcript_14444:211-3333(+)|eukprot:CAMPEP_0178983854 /NCGR_PEP_ID=MMETSP0795-20121207/1290_1 /TAXON_ID=88552 /ORGANISM="Amoebophrya sp., Strain Ameob2" /LENGTH=1040 /DNA_ID=CAMNT_0020674671 /DNA_START=117 /DNA_END=3239 /DNA_ORIENTATION=+